MKGKEYKKVGQFDRRRPFSRKDAAEFRVGKKEFVMCLDCKNVYYKKSWHRDFPNNMLPERKGVHFFICPACKMAKDGRFEGQVVIENVPKGIHAELIGLIKNFGKVATENDPQDRITEIKEAGSTIEVFTTENQLAKRIAHRIKETYGKKVKQKIIFSRGEDVVRARLTLP